MSTPNGWRQISGVKAFAFDGILLSDLPDITNDKITSLDANKLTGTVNNDRLSNVPVNKITGLGSLATKSNITNEDIASNAAINVSKVSGLGSLATVNRITDAHIDNGSLSQAKINGLSTTLETKTNAGELRLTNLTTFPSNPVVGQFANVNNIIYLYVGV
ncbi:MAG: hypothetical protein FWG98_06710 [Candidatus Cloacimonetes bacterium]|nr:hypothetical protein [Candidatus Cloacimonadota bacterium]